MANEVGVTKCLDVLHGILGSLGGLWVPGGMIRPLEVYMFVLHVKRSESSAWYLYLVVAALFSGF